MSEMWKRWEGQVIDHKYQLRQFLGSTDHSAVFYAEFHAPELRKAAVKFLAADLPHAEQVLAEWKRAQQLSHPNLLPIYSVGRCNNQDMDLIYAAMEYADENLSEILPHRALTAPEAQEMLTVIADVLVYLHACKLTHGHIKPSNIFAIGDQLKLSSDTIQPLATAREMRRKRDVYDAPEIPATPFSPAADVWSLGVTLVEALTQQPAVLPFNESAEPVVPPALRDSFREIAVNSLRRDPAARCSSVDIAVKLNPEAGDAVKAALAAAAAANTAAANSSAMNAAAAPGVSAVAVAPVPSASASGAAPVSQALPAQPPPSPLSVPLSKEPAVPLSKQPSANPAAPLRPPMPPPPITRPEPKPPSRSAVVLPNYVVPLFAIVLILAAIVALPKILHRETRPSASAPTQTASASAPASNSASSPNSNAASVPKATPAPPNNPSPSTNSSASSASTPSSTPSAAPSPSPVGSSPSTSAAILHDSPSAPPASTKKAASSPDRGEVLDQVLPRPGSAALATIQGTVRVVVRVQVDPAGNVSQAALENPSSSRYFADMSTQAARGWVFLAPTAESGHGESSEWLIRFEFTTGGVNAYPKQVKP